MNGENAGPEGSKVIAVFSDGTGNSAAKLFKTNVWRLYQAVDLADPKGEARRQVAFYDDGVGSSTFKLLAALGGIFGFGLKRNVLELYRFVCRNYRPGDDICAFGFSRGAFTIRILVALIAIQGLRRYEGERLLDLDARDAYRKYRRRFKAPWSPVPILRNLRDAVLRAWYRGERSSAAADGRRVEVPCVAFVGVWDTVAAYGLPIAELTRGIDRWVFPLSMPNYVLSAKVAAARHALALDDERDTFHPLLWDEVAEAGMIAGQQVAAGRLRQVWFAGMHADVGGGYPQDGLAHVSLQWMLEEAEAHGLRFRADSKLAIAAAADPFGPMHQSRAGFGAYYRYQPRRIDARMEPPAPGTALMRDPRLEHGMLLPPIEVHDSVPQRIERGTDAYAPIVLPRPPGWVPPAGGVQPTQAPDALWNEVWRRRVNYFAAVLLTIVLVLFRWIWDAEMVGSCFGAPQCVVSPVIAAAGKFAPELAQPWLKAYAASPIRFAVLVILLFILTAHAGRIQQRIQDGMRRLWVGAPGPWPARWSDRWILGLRTSRPYERFFQILKWTIVPPVFVVLVLVFCGWLGWQIGVAAGLL